MPEKYYKDFLQESAVKYNLKSTWNTFYLVSAWSRCTSSDTLEFNGKNASPVILRPWVKVRQGIIPNSLDQTIGKQDRTIQSNHIYHVMSLQPSSEIKKPLYWMGHAMCGIIWQLEYFIKKLPTLMAISVFLHKLQFSCRAGFS